MIPRTATPVAAGFPSPAEQRSREVRPFHALIVSMGVASTLCCSRPSLPSSDSATADRSERPPRPASADSHGGSASMGGAGDPDAAAPALKIVELTGRGEASCSYMPAAKNNGTDECACDFFVRPSLNLAPPPPAGQKVHNVLTLDETARPSVRVPGVGGCSTSLRLIVQPTFEYVSLGVTGPGCDVFAFFNAVSGKNPGIDATVRGTYLGRPIDVHVKIDSE